MGSAEAAELTKLAETTYRDVNIALANEFARFADRVGVDVHSVIDAANSQPLSHIHRPGIAVGGHCIPVYPRFYLTGDPDARLPADSRAINDGMPGYAVELLEHALGGSLRDARVLILGVSYRGDVKETAFSGAFALRDKLTHAGSTVFAADPLYSDAELEAHGFVPWRSDGIDAAIIQADHADYASLQAEDLPGLRVLLDGRRAVDAAPWRAAGVNVVRIGEGRR